MELFKCPTCELTFARKFNRDRHFRLTHNNIIPIYQCKYCGASFRSSKSLYSHYDQHTPETSFTLHQSAFRKKCAVYRKIFNPTFPNLGMCCQYNDEEVKNLLRFEVAKRKSVKISIIYHVEFRKIIAEDYEGDDNDDDEDEEENNDDDDDEDENDDEEENEEKNNKGERIEMCFRSPARLVINDNEVYRLMQDSRLITNDRIDDFLENGSGWVLDCIRGMDLELGNCRPLNGCCGKLQVKFTKDISRIKNGGKDEKCFLQAIAYHFVKKENVKKLNRFIKKKIIVCIENPVNVKDIPKFESINKHLKLKINVLHMDEEGEVFPILISKNTTNKNIINLVLYKTLIDGKVVNHYSYITNLDKFLRKTYKTNKQSYKRSVYCVNCFSSFSSSQILSRHEKLCLKNKPQRVKIPLKGDKVVFKNFEKKFKCNYIGFFDFEAKHVAPRNDDDHDQKTKVLAIQEPITVSFLILDSNSKIILQDTYTGNDCASYFLNSLITAEEELLSNLNNFPDLNMSIKNEEDFKKSEICHVCEKELDDSDKVRDHCHVTGKYLGAAHNNCNLKRVESKKIPMFCHNFSGYDGHFIMEALGKTKNVTKIEALPYNTEKFRTIQINSFVFLDSLSFLNASLNELMCDLVKNKNHKFKILRQQKLYRTISEKKLLLRKGVFPYEFVTSIEKLKKTCKIPKKDQFFSKLTNSNISDSDYFHAKKVFKKFKCQDMLDYTELYCKLDVGILAEVVCQFRNIIYEKFQLDCW